jgi:hypothetical protein
MTKHEIVAGRLDTIAMATGILAGAAAAGAVWATPTGLAAVGVWLGLVDEPWIVRIAPVFDTLATVSGTISGGGYFFVRWRKQRRHTVENDNL